MNRFRRSRDERGATLMLALAFVMMFGLVVSALATTLSAGLHTSTVNADVTNRLYATDGGIDYGIHQLAADQNGDLCPHTGSTDTIGTQTLNGQSVTVTCTTLSGDVGDSGSGGVGGTGSFGPSGWTLVATGYVDAANPPQWKHKGGGDCNNNLLPQSDRGSMIQIFMCPGTTSGIARTVHDSHVTTGSTTLTSATAHFTTGDIGATITGDGIPTGTKITLASNVTTITMSKAATATSTTGTLNVAAQSTGEQTIYGGTKIFNAGGFYLPYSNNVTVQGTVTQYDNAGYCTRDQSVAHFPPANNPINPVVQTGWVCTQPGSTAIPDPKPIVVVPTNTAPAPVNQTTCHDGATKVSYKYPGIYTTNPNPANNTFLASGVYYFLTSGETAFGATIWGGEPSAFNQNQYDDPAQRAEFPGIDVWGNFQPYPAGCTRAVTDGGVTAGSKTLTSASASFNANDVNSKVKGTGIPFGTTITAVAITPAHSVIASTLNSGTKKTFTLGAGSPTTLSQADVGATVTYTGGGANPLAAGTTIASVQDSTHATLSKNVTATVTNKTFTITPTTGPSATLSQAATSTSTTDQVTILNGFSDAAANAACNGCMNSYNSNPGKGVTFIMGGATIFDIHTGTLELFSRTPGSMDTGATQATTIFAMGTTNPPAGEILGGPYQTSLTWSTTGGDRCNCAFVTDHANNQIVFHGLTYTPYEPIDVFSNQGTNYSPFFGGLVANWIVTHLDSNSSSGLFAGQFGAFGGTAPSDRTIVVTATGPPADSGATRKSTAVIVIHVDGSPPTIQSWRNTS